MEEGKHLLAWSEIFAKTAAILHQLKIEVSLGELMTFDVIIAVFPETLKETMYSTVRRKKDKY